tara:strand:+ start:182 stop:379 length:198 start_codon:yes stop_codon:yes gene_type:complete
MFGRKTKNKRSHNFKVQKPLTRSRLDKVIDILDAAAAKDNRPKTKKAVKRKAKTNNSNWNPTINW